MNLRVFSLILTLVLVPFLSVNSKEFSENELLEIGRKALQEHSSAKSDQEKIEAFRRALLELSDTQKIRAIGYRVLASDDNSRYEMKSSNSMAASYALGQDPELIQDWSEIGRMIKEANSPRHFFLLSTLATTKRGANHSGFVAERTHMLFADGRVAKDEGEYTAPYADDVSKYAYTAIVGNLRALKADFEAPAKNLRHEEQVIILVNWLRENWPGCENLGDGERLMADTIRPSKQPTKEAVRPEKRMVVENHGAVPSSSVNNTILWLVTALCGGLLLVLAGWYVKRVKS